METNPTPSTQIQKPANEPSPDPLAPMMKAPQAGRWKQAILLAIIVLDVATGIAAIMYYTHHHANGNQLARQTLTTRKLVTTGQQTQSTAAPTATPDSALPNDADVFNPPASSASDDSSSQNVTQNSLDFAVRDATNALQNTQDSLHASE